MLVDLREPKDAPAAQRLEMYWPLIRAAVWRWADPGRWDHEDLVQEAALAVWLVLRDRPDVSVSFMRVVADHAARDSLIRGRSVDRVLVGGKKKGGRIQNPWSLVSMDALQEDPMRWRTFESRLVGMARRSGGDLPSPTEDLAVAQILYKELWDTLTPRQRSVLDLRLAGYTRADVARRLRIRENRVHYIIKAIQARAKGVWEEPRVRTCVMCGAMLPGGSSPRRRYCSNACSLRFNRKRKKHAASKRRTT